MLFSSGSRPFSALAAESTVVTAQVEEQNKFRLQFVFAESMAHGPKKKSTNISLQMD